MGELNVCRVCLADNVKMMDLHETHYQEVFSKVTSHQLWAQVSVRTVCAWCAARLARAHRLLQTALHSEKTLVQLLYNGMLSQKTVGSLTREAPHACARSPVQSVCAAGAAPRVKEEGVKREPARSLNQALYYLVHDSDEAGDPAPAVSPVSVYIKIEPAEAADETEHAQDSQEAQSIPPPHTTASPSPSPSPPPPPAAPSPTPPPPKPKSAPTDKSFTCHTCNKKFTLNSSLKRHIRIHTGEKPYACELCDKRFNQKSHLIIHAKHHTGEKPFECQVCHKTFGFGYRLKAHMQAHSGVKPFTCDICGKKIRFKSHLIEHIKTHTGEKPYSCDVCHARFNQKISLINHTTTHTGEKAFACQRCDKRFSRKTSLKIHTLTHTGERPFACDVCARRFNHGANLERHLRIHTGEKPYSCALCRKQFNQNSSLKTHLMVHARNGDGDGGGDGGGDCDKLARFVPEIEITEAEPPNVEIVCEVTPKVEGTDD